ncbi:cell division protein FtsL [Agaribacterium haliotis]|uniref:cell division protein FtsL n=1 Tax=Agaribacterium haliotis TaxID=2013869 RepID=UPI000BB55791|nr:cell division protein FtsL [Agaribacterium haliotis]
MDNAINIEDGGSRGTIRAVAFVVLWLSTLVSGLAVVYSTYMSRIQVQELESLRREASALKVSAGQYQLEMSSLASYSRIESVAYERLKMQAPLPEHTVLVEAQ